MHLCAKAHSDALGTFSKAASGNLKVTGGKGRYQEK